jgi:hypothetical protein
MTHECGCARALTADEQTAPRTAGDAARTPGQTDDARHSNPEQTTPRAHTHQRSQADDTALPVLVPQATTPTRLVCHVL